MKNSMLKKCLSVAFSMGMMVGVIKPTLAFETKPAPCNTEACLDLKKDPWVATGLNLIPLGVGSFHQGDAVGGTVVAAIDAVSLVSILAPFTVFPQAMQNGGWSAAFLIGYGGAGLLLGRLVGVTVPWIHYASYEKGKADAQLGFTNLEPGPSTLALVNYQWEF